MRKFRPVSRAWWILLSGLAMMLPARFSFAFPEMVRHNYVNCTACHVSPSGGGVLTAYGRSMAKEVLSTWGYEGEEGPGHGLIKQTPEWLILGGDVRWVQTYLDTPAVREGDAFWMQSDLELGVQNKKWIAVGTIGAEGGPDSYSERGEFISRRHYLNYRPTEQISLRAGRFTPQFGINQANHTLVTRGGLPPAGLSGLGFMPGTETYNMEAAWIGDQFDVFATGIMGRPDDPNVRANKGAALSTSYALFDKHKIGASYWRTQTDTQRREMYGAWGILGFTHHFFILAEIDYLGTRNRQSDAFRQQYVSYLRVNYEWRQGVHAYIFNQNTDLMRTGDLPHAESIGLGIQLFPRPHFEINAEFQHVGNTNSFAGVSDAGMLLLHYYL
jgi:hypothetical protein